MSNKNTVTNAVIISADTRLQRILFDHTSDNDNVKISLESNFANLDSISTPGAYVYDVELTNNDLVSTITEISNLKKIIADKPLILIGKKHVLSEVLSSEKIAEMVSKTINKPISYGQLKLVINSCLQKPTLKSQPRHQENRSNQRRVVVFSLTVAFILFGAITYLKTTEFPTNNPSLSVDITNSAQNISTASNINSAKLEMDNLNQLALIALQEGRLIEPANHNASYFLKQIKRIDPYNATANQTHNKLFNLLEADYTQQYQQTDDAATKNALLSILHIEPYNHKYAQLLRELEERIYLEGRNRSNNNATTNAALNLNESVELESQNDDRNKLSLNLSPKSDNEQPITNTSLLVSIDKEISVTPTVKTKPAEVISPKADREQPVTNTLLLTSIDKEVSVASTVKTKPAEVIKRTEPYYPRLAVDLNYEGWVELEYQVDARGQATNIKVMNGERIKTFEKAAINAIEDWEFTSAIDTTTNTPILSEPMLTKFNFSLD